MITLALKMLWTAPLDINDLGANRISTHALPIGVLLGAGASASEMATHLAALDPHGQYSLETDVTNALALKVNNNAIGAPSGVAPLNGNSNVPEQYLSFVQTGTGAVATTVQSKLRESVSVKDFGAVGDGVTDDTAAIQKAIDFAFANSVRRILFESNHLVTDLNLTKLYYCGLILEGLNTTHQPSAATLIVTGANSQGIDISGTNGLIFRNITIRGNASAAPRCAIFASRVVGSQESAAHVFDRLSIYGTFTKAAIYNFAGELWSLNSLRVNISGACHGGYFTSYNSLGLTSKFQTPNTAVTPMTGTTLSNPYIQVSGSGIAGLWFEQDPGSPPDATLQGVYINGGYFTSRGGAECSIKLTEVLGNISIENSIDESFSTGDATACSTIIKHSGSRVLRGLSIKKSVFYGRTNVISANSVQDYTAEGNYVWNPNISWVFSTLNNAYHKTLFDNELFSVSAGANINVVPLNRNSAANISIPITRTNQGYDNKYRGSPLNNVNPERRDISMLDSLHNRLFTAVGSGASVDSTSWREVVTKQLSSTIPTSGNYAAGQLIFNSVPNTSTNRTLGFIATTAGTMGTLGCITATTTASSASVTFVCAAGLSEGAYISIAGVTGTKQIVTLSGLNATLDSACDASVTGASVSFVPATFYRVGPLNILSAASSQTVSLAAGATTSFTVTVTGAEMGDFAQISYSTASVGSLIVSGSVTATNTVTVSIYNPTGGTINTGTGNWWALVTKR